MTLKLQNQIIKRLKNIKCKQKNCHNNNQDNIDLIVFGKKNLKRDGLMCSQCLIDSQLIKQIQPVQKHSISIRKFLKTLTKKYQQYIEQKQSVNWGPNLLQLQKIEIKELLTKQQQIIFNGLKQINKFVQDLENKTLQQIRQLHKDISFQNLSALLEEENQEQQQKINVEKDLKSITSKLMAIQGQYRLSNENQIKQKHEQIMNRYKKGMAFAKRAIQGLINIQKQTKKQIGKI